MNSDNQQIDGTEVDNYHFIHSGRTMKKERMSKGEFLLCNAYKVNGLSYDLEKVRELRDSLIKGVRDGLINEEMMYSYIKQNSGRIDAGLVSTVLCMSILPEEVTKRKDLEEITQPITANSNSLFRKLERAHKIAFNEKYGFFAYQGDYFKGAEKFHMTLSEVDEAEGFRDSAGERMNVKGNAYNFKDNAGNGMTAKGDAYNFKDNAGNGMNVKGNALEFGDNAGERMTVEGDAWRFGGNAGNGMTVEGDAYYFTSDAGNGMNVKGDAYNFKDNAGNGIQFKGGRFPSLKKFWFLIKKIKRNFYS